jgi:murein DD-endopeptidase MepM/ murein hydrolase activator NlpD
MTPLRPPYDVVTTPYGKPGPWAAGYHTGEDYSTHGVTRLLFYAVRDGEVVAVGHPWGRAYGLTLVIEGRRHRIRMGYCHLDQIFWDVGKVVTAGQVLGRSGNTGRTTGPHLHYEERVYPFHYGDDREPRFTRSEP